MYRLYKEECLILKRVQPANKRKAARQREEKFKPAAQDQAWSSTSLQTSCRMERASVR